MSNGRKIDDVKENPIDNILINITEYLNPLYKSLHFTPNILTFLSLLSTLVGLYIYTKNYIVLGSILYFVGYYFDCADGNFARRYNMTSRFGDYFDHISDVIKFLLLIYMIYLQKIHKNTKTTVFIIFAILSILILVHIGCQEKNYPKTDSVLTNLIILCKEKKYIHITRFFGIGTMQFAITIILLFLKNIDKFIKEN